MIIKFHKKEPAKEEQKADKNQKTYDWFAEWANTSNASIFQHVIWPTEQLNALRRQTRTTFYDEYINQPLAAEPDLTTTQNIRDGYVRYEYRYDQRTNQYTLVRLQ